MVYHGLKRQCRWPEEKILFLGQNISLNDQTSALQITFPVPSWGLPMQIIQTHSGGKNPFFFLLFMHRVKNIGSISFTSTLSDLLLYRANCSKTGWVSSKSSASHHNGVGFPNLASARHKERGFRMTERLELWSKPNTMKCSRMEGLPYPSKMVWWKGHDSHFHPDTPLISA